MAFTIAYSRKNKFSRPAAAQALFGFFIIVFMLLPLKSVDAEQTPPGFYIQSLETLMRDRVYLLNAHFNYVFSKEAVEALEHGVPLLILVDIEILTPRWYWSDKTIAELEQGYLLLYHALSESYIVNNLNSGTQNNFVSLEQALNFLNTIKELPVLDANLLKSDKDYYLRVRTHLDIESLPAPMRPLAYISSDWQLASDWYEWPLQK